MTLGRPPIKNRENTRYSLDLPSPEFITKLDEIAKSQSTSRRKYIISVLQKAIDDHEKEGQTAIADFTEGAPETDNLAFMRVTQLLKSQKDVKKITIIRMFRDGGIYPPKLIEFTEKAVQYLQKKGVKVYR